jgi:thioredoxin-related protein
MDRRIVRWGMSGLLVTSMAVGAIAATNPADSKRKTNQSPQSTQPPQAAPSIRWIYDLQSAHKQCLVTGKPMLIVCGGPSCIYCRKLEKEVLGNSTIARYINNTFIAVHLDCKKDQRAVEILEIRSLPTTVILSPEADLLGSIEGFVKIQDYASVLKQSVEFQKSLKAKSEPALARKSR